MVRRVMRRIVRVHHTAHATPRAAGCRRQARGSRAARALPPGAARGAARRSRPPAAAAASHRLPVQGHTRCTCMHMPSRTGTVCALQRPLSANRPDPWIGVGPLAAERRLRKQGAGLSGPQPRPHTHLYACQPTAAPPCTSRRTNAPIASHSCGGGDRRASAASRSAVRANWTSCSTRAGRSAEAMRRASHACVCRACPMHAAGVGRGTHALMQPACGGRATPANVVPIG